MIACPITADIISEIVIPSDLVYRFRNVRQYLIIILFIILMKQKEICKCSRGKVYKDRTSALIRYPNEIRSSGFIISKYRGNARIKLREISFNLKSGVFIGCCVSMDRIGDAQFH